MVSVLVLRLSLIGMARSINTQHFTACQQRHIPKRGHARLSQGSLTIDQPCPSHLTSSSSTLNLIFITFARLPRGSIRFPLELQAASLPYSPKASLSLCTRPKTNRPAVQPAAELRAPVAAVPRTTGRQKFESTLTQPFAQHSLRFYSAEPLSSLRQHRFPSPVPSNHFRQIHAHSSHYSCYNVDGNQAKHAANLAHRQLFDSYYSWALGIYSNKF